MSVIISTTHRSRSQMHAALVSGLFIRPDEQSPSTWATKNMRGEDTTQFTAAVPCGRSVKLSSRRIVHIAVVNQSARGADSSVYLAACRRSGSVSLSNRSMAVRPFSRSRRRSTRLLQLTPVHHLRWSRRRTLPTFPAAAAAAEFHAADVKLTST